MLDHLSVGTGEANHDASIVSILATIVCDHGRTGRHLRHHNRSSFVASAAGDGGDMTWRGDDGGLVRLHSFSVVHYVQ